MAASEVGPEQKNLVLDRSRVLKSTILVPRFLKYLLH